MNIFDHLSRRSSFSMHVPTCIFTHICICAMKLEAPTLLFTWVCMQIFCLLNIFFYIHHSYYTYTFFVCIIFSWLIHFFKYACIFSNAFSCVLMCYICFLHTPFILHVYFFLHAWNFHVWYIFLNMHAYFQMAEVVFWCAVCILFTIHK